MKTLTVNTAQGLGDCIWTWQKLAPHVDQLDFNILCVSLDPVQKRAEKFLRMLPKLNRITYVQVSGERYDQVAKTSYQVKPLLEDFSKPHDFSANGLLEKGVRLESFDTPEVAWEVPFAVPETLLHAGKEYVCVYVSGNKSDKTWSVWAWSSFLRRLFAENNIKLPVVLLGAGYDSPVLVELSRHLARVGIETSLQIDGPPEDCIRTIREANLFVGYQSGLNVLADIYDVPQIMLYFPQLEAMMGSWCKPGHLNKVYFPFLFQNTVDHIIENSRNLFA